MVKKWTERLAGCFFKIENEIMLPFILVGILVTGAFSVISVYNGYTMKMEAQREYAKTAFRNINMDLVYMNGRMDEARLEEKYRLYADSAMRITTRDGRVLTGDETFSEGNKVVLAEDTGNPYGWKLQYVLDKSKFNNDILEEQSYVIVGAVASLLIIVQVSVFLAWNLTKPIRNMSAACREIDKDREGYREYRFEEVRRRDEIGQLARTFETLLKNLDNYTKMEYTSRMSSALAHEIKNPLTGIRSGVQVLRGRVAKDNERLLCDSMLHEIDRVTGLINDLFTLSVKKENMKKVIAMEPFLEEIGMFYTRGLEQQKIAFKIEAEPGITAFADENEMRQMIHNLVTNSIKAVEKDGSGEISLKAAAEGDKTVLTFSDNGKGMTGEELKRAREPFYTKSINGVGLGLAIVSRLAEQNLAVMDMESEPGAGTTVRLTFERGGRNEKGIDC